MNTLDVSGSKIHSFTSQINILIYKYLSVKWRYT